MEGLEIDKRPTRSPGPTVEQARAFCAVAGAVSYKQAADRLHLSEHVPVIRLVNRFSKALGRGRLVLSNPRGEVWLTPAGREILPAAQRFVDSALALRELPAEIRFSAYPTIAGRVAQRCGDLLEAPVPLVMHDISEASREDGGWGLVHDVVAGRLDMAIAPIGLAHAGLEEHFLYAWRLRVVLPEAESPLSGRKRVTPADLASWRIAASPVGHTSRDLLEAAFAAQGVDLKVALESPNQELLRSVARGGQHYVAVMPDDAFDTPDVRRGPCLTAPGMPRLGGGYALYIRPTEWARGHSGASSRDAAISAAALSLREALRSPRR